MPRWVLNGVGVNTRKPNEKLPIGNVLQQDVLIPVGNVPEPLPEGIRKGSRTKCEQML